MLGEASTTEIAKNKNAQGFGQNKQAAKEGGTVAGNAKQELEEKSGKRVTTTKNYLPSSRKKQAKMKLLLHKLKNYFLRHHAGMYPDFS